MLILSNESTLKSLLTFRIVYMNEQKVKKVSNCVVRKIEDKRKVFKIKNL